MGPVIVIILVIIALFSGALYLWIQTSPKDDITDFNLNNCKPHGNQGYKRVLLQLFGFSGHGKSSFINTCKYVLKESEYKNNGNVGTSDAEKTTHRISYPLTKTITMVENRGCPMMRDYERGEIYAQLGHLLPLEERGYRGLMYKIVEEKLNPNYSDILVPVFVYSVKKGINTEELPNLKKLLDNAKKLTGIVPFVVLTFKTQGNLSDVEAKFRNIGIDHILKLENLTQDDHIDFQSRRQEVRKFLCEVLKDVKYHMRDRRDPKREREDREKFVLEFAHEMKMGRRLNEMLRSIDTFSMLNAESLKFPIRKKRSRMETIF